MGDGGEEGLLALWQTTKNPWYHRYLHLYEIANWLPWVLGIASAFTMLLATRRSARGAARARRTATEEALASSEALLNA